MDDSLKRRLVGAIVLVSLVVIFVPMLLEDEPMFSPGITTSNIPPPPQSGKEFSSRIQPLETETPSAVVPAGPVEAAAPAPAPAPLPAAAEATPSETPQPRVGLSAWVVQVGSFGARENADQLVEQLRQKQLPAFMEPVSIDKKTMYRVRVGPEVDQKKAALMQAEIEKILNLKTRLEQYP